MKDYFIGLDIGTDSVGWAVTDTEYHVQKKNGKALWGVRLFDPAQTAADRRGFRVARRRIERRKQRIEWLREMFAHEIAKVDPAFFLRVDESKFLETDKRLMENGQPLGRYTLFADRNFTDKDYHKAYPTIYHLRLALMKQDHPFDIRLVYLAIHHMMKNRGHFLFGDMNLDDVTFESCLAELKELLQNEYDLVFDLADPEGFRQALTNRKLTATGKKAALRKASGYAKADVQQWAVCDLLAGGTVKPSALLNREFSKEDDKGITFKGDFESKEAELADVIGEDMQLVYLIKKLYDWSLLDELRAGKALLSEAKVAVYEQHKKDLAVFKRLLRHNTKVYKEMFGAAKDKLNNYSAYTGHRAANYRCSYDDFSKYARKQLEAVLPLLDEADAQLAGEIRTGLENGSFLAMQTSKNNGVIPHQLHEQELELILKKAGSYLPFLNEKDESGLTLQERILAMFRFRIPYYVGPLYHAANSKNDHSWVVRTGERITPWNFEKVVDLEKCAENFITRMTAVCSYIGEPVLPTDSLLYSRFTALNMINKIRINDKPISPETKQRIFTECLLANGKGTFQTVRSFLLANGLMQKNDELGGIDKDFRVALNGYRIFARILQRENTTMMVEDIIRHIVLFGEDRKLLERWLKKEYGKALTEEDRAYVIRNRSSFKGWGRLSAEFLTEIKHADPETGELFSIIDMLWQTNENLMELLSERYSFGAAVETYRREKYAGKERTIDDVLADSYASPGIRRAIHQAMRIVAEIEKIMGGEPKRVFVEVTREEGEKNSRTTSRRMQLESLYAACKEEYAEVYGQLQRFDDAALRSTKLYLYFSQLGRCMYSGEPIDLERLGVDYDIDHIYPQMKVKDDSLINRVLVKKQLNAAKSDKYPLSADVQQKMRGFWGMLKDKGLLDVEGNPHSGAEKLRRLTRTTPFSDDELSGFIARQLVETSQACKIVAEILRERYQGADKVVYVKAKNVSGFRQDQRILPDGTQVQAWACKGIETKQDPLFVKCREVNDFHHAKDAYLNIVVGNVYHVKFTRNPINFIKGGQTYSMNRMFDYDVQRGGEVAWRKGDEGTIATVRHTMRKNNILFTRYAHEVGGGLFDQMLVPKGGGQAMAKASDPRMTTEKYGGYNKLTGAYFCLVEHTEKKKRVRSIEAVLLMYKAMYEAQPEAYCEKVLGLKEPKILIRQIKINSLVSLNGFRMHVSGRTGTRIIFKNANQLVLSPDDAAYIKQIAKYMSRCMEARAELMLTAYDGITPQKNRSMYQLLVAKLETSRYDVKYATARNTLREYGDRFEKLSLYEQCSILMQVLNLFKTTAASADLKLLCGKAGIGILLVSKNIDQSAGYQMKLIHQSVTGFFEQEIDLLGDKF